MQLCAEAMRNAAAAGEIGRHAVTRRDTTPFDAPESTESAITRLE